MPVTNLRFNILSNWNGDGVRAARRDISAASSDIQRSSRQVATAARGFFSLSSAVMTLGPALLPIGTVALGVAGGLTAAAAGAGLAGGAFLAVAATAAANADKMGTAGKKFSTSLDGVKTAWMNLAKATAPLTLGPMTSVLNGAVVAIGRLKPLIQAVAPLAAQMGKAIGSWLAGGGFQRFVSVLISQGVPALRNFIAAGRSMTTVLGNAFRAFLPLGVSVSAAIARGAAALARWSNDGGFQRFIATVRANAPAVREFFRALGPAIQNIGRAMAILAPVSLAVATALAKIVAAIPPQVLAGVIAGLMALRAAILALRVATLAAAAVRLLAAALMLLVAHPVIAAIAAIVVAIIVFKRHWDQMRAAGASPINFVVRLLGAAGLGGTIRNITTAWRTLQSLNRVSMFVMRLVGGFIRGIIAGIIAIWRQCLGVAARIARFVMRLVGQAIAGPIRLVSAAWRAALGLAARVARFVARLVGGGIAGPMRVLTATWRVVVSTAGRVARFLARLQGGGIVGAMRGIVGAWNSVLSAARKVATFIIRKITGKAGGGPITAAPGYAIGGSIGGRGGPRSDKQPIMASPGEFMINARAARAWGPAFMHMVNGGPTKAMRYGDVMAAGKPRASTPEPKAFAGSGGGRRRSGGGREVHIHIHGNVYTKSRAEFEDMVVHAVSEAKRRKRI